MGVYVNKYDRNRKCSNMGEDAVNRFDEVIVSINGKSTPSSIKEDIHDHIDRHVKLNDKKFTVDVKSAKSVVRDGAIVYDDVWVEFKNVQGQPGWLYGKQDLLAFELQKHHFILVARKLLASLCEDIVDMDTKVTSAGQALYKAYTRSGRRDLISRIRVEDIKKIKHIMLTKKENKNGK